MGFNTDIYNANYRGVVTNLAPPNHRTPKVLSWLTALTYPLKWLHDLVFIDYAGGVAYPQYNPGNTYNIGDRVNNGFVFNGTTITYYGDRAVYEAIAAVPANMQPPNATYWYQRQPLYIGLRERLNYNSQLIMLNYILNKWFNVTEAPWIYVKNNAVDIDGFWLSDNNGSATMGNNANQRFFLGTGYGTNQYNFTIYVPHLLYGSFSPSPVKSIEVTDPGSGYDLPVVTISGGDGSGAHANAVEFASQVVAINLVSGGSGYLYPPIVTITSSDGHGSGAKAVAILQDNTKANNLIRAIADKYVIAGELYNIVTY